MLLAKYGLEPARMWRSFKSVACRKSLWRCRRKMIAAVMMSHPMAYVAEQVERSPGEPAKEEVPSCTWALLRHGILSRSGAQGKGDDPRLWPRCISCTRAESRRAIFERYTKIKDQGMFDGSINGMVSSSWKKCRSSTAPAFKSR
jgi:hypothetical protein